MLLLLCRQGAWPNKRPRPMPAGPGGKDVVVKILAHDSSHGPAEAGHVVAVDFAHGFDHETPVPPQRRKIKRCADVSCSLEASPFRRIHPPRLCGALLTDHGYSSGDPARCPPTVTRRICCDRLERAAIGSKPNRVPIVGASALGGVADDYSMSVEPPFLTIAEVVPAGEQSMSASQKYFSAARDPLP